MTAFIAEERVLLSHMNCTVNSGGESGWNSWYILVGSAMNCCSDLLMALTRSTIPINACICNKDLKTTRNLNNRNSNLHILLS